MMGSPIILIFLLPLMLLTYFLPSVGDMLGIDVEAVWDSFMAWFHDPEVENTIISICDAIGTSLAEILDVIIIN